MCVGYAERPARTRSAARGLGRHGRRAADARRGRHDPRFRQHLPAPRSRTARRAATTAKRRSIVCPYHSWTYRLDGSTAQRAGPARRPRLRPGRVRARPAAASSTGTAGCSSTPSGTGGDFADHVAGTEEIVSAATAPKTCASSPGHSYELACNWKVIAENYQECYHCSTIHPELSRISPPTSGDNLDLAGQWMGGSMELIPEADTMSLDGHSGGVAIAGLSDTSCARSCISSATRTCS